MTTREELLQRGAEVRQQLQHGAYGSSGTATNAAVAGVSRLTQELVFGAVWGRPGLDLRHRMICTLAILSVLQRLSQLRTYIHSALTLGVEAREIQEIFIQGAVYGGFPTMVNALGIAREVFEQRGVVVSETTLPEYSLQELEDAGRAIRQSLQGSQGQQGYTAPDALGTDLFRLALQYGYGEVWQRPGLDRKGRMACAIGAFVALGCEPQLRGFLPAALRVGFSRDEVIEMVLHTAPYGGFPRALNAMALANEVLK
ncbi:MAG: carboxymuconolactone decarboxylase family protein [Candidatus Tectimicrobiota bacterium]